MHYIYITNTYKNLIMHGNLSFIIPFDKLQFHSISQLTFFKKSMSCHEVFRAKPTNAFKDSHFLNQ